MSTFDRILPNIYELVHFFTCLNHTRCARSHMFNVFNRIISDGSLWRNSIENRNVLCSIYSIRIVPFWNNWFNKWWNENVFEVSINSLSLRTMLKAATTNVDRQTEANFIVENKVILWTATNFLNFFSFRHQFIVENRWWLRKLHFDNFSGNEYCAQFRRIVFHFMTPLVTIAKKIIFSDGND